MKFVYNFFYAKLLYISSMKRSLNRTTIFKLIVHEIELYAAFEERENKQKNVKLLFKNLELSFFSNKIVLVMKFCGKRKITLNYTMFININGLWQCLHINHFMSDCSSLFVQSFPKWFVHIWMTFCENSIRISCQTIFVNKHWPQSCPSPFKPVV